MKDIETRVDIDRLMHVFYERALADDVIGYLFTDVAKLDLDKHLPIIGDFWESLLFGTGVYQQHSRNPLMVHHELHTMSTFFTEHFERWLELFEKAVDEDFRGDRAEFIKMRAHAIARRFQNYLEVRPASVFRSEDSHEGNRARPE